MSSQNITRTGSAEAPSEAHPEASTWTAHAHGHGEGTGSDGCASFRFTPSVVDIYIYQIQIKGRLHSLGVARAMVRADRDGG